jgi:peptidyl-prolyl cis-trans isomerase SurA
MCAGIVPAFSQPQEVDAILGVVSSQIVTGTEVGEFTQPAMKSLLRQYSPQSEEFHQKLMSAQYDSLQQLIERQLILHSFEVDGYKMPESVIDEIVQDRIREQFGDRITFMKSLQTKGLTVEQFRKQVRDQYIESAMRNLNVQREIFVSPYKVEKYYLAHTNDFVLQEQVKLRMIVLSKSGPDDTNTFTLAQEIRAKIKDGAAFDVMATIHSQGSQQHQGGDWGWVERTVLRKELADVAFTLPVNAVSETIDTPDTCYLMLVEDKRSSRVRPLTDVAVDIERILRLQEQKRLQDQWIAGLRKKTFVRYFMATQ